MEFRWKKGIQISFNLCRTRNFFQLVIMTLLRDKHEVFGKCLLESEICFFDQFPEKKCHVTRLNTKVFHKIIDFVNKTSFFVSPKMSSYHFLCHTYLKLTRYNWNQADDLLIKKLLRHIKIFNLDALTLYDLQIIY
jgi:hypothetical protein